MNKNKGAFANQTGQALEEFVYNALRRYEYNEIQTNKSNLFETRQTIKGKQFAHQLKAGQTIYETQRNCDFFIFNQNKWRKGLIIECKWQQTAGSTDEKFPYLIENIKKTGIPSIILLDGDGYKPGAKKWLQSQCNILKYLLIGVFNMMEFQTQINKGFLE